jgi:branched-subunit amino acid aminotransferase/4-amino-4-deoxychorismate lyase
MTAQPQRPAFGTLLTSHMAVATYSDGWSKSEIKPVGPIEISPAAHMLHYASTCFEGFKAFRRADGSVHVFRMDRHIQRLQQSTRRLVLPEPDPAQVADMVRAVINRCRDAVPEAPGALYLRPIILAPRQTSARPRHRRPRRCWWCSRARCGITLRAVQNRCEFSSTIRTRARQDTWAW